MTTSDNGTKYTLAFVGYGNEESHTVLELTYNWEKDSYQHGYASGHIAIGVDDIYQACEEIKNAGGCVFREPGPVKGGKHGDCLCQGP